ncbi:hypothetical protein Mal64_37660 [Pseudobythopirellula maris]|uniref:Uncharacterized protein n=1 Tax=Pseudobythopirellula maris TaxID=2527991 RepID=A0A5C5ZI74_9BACT|nr:hypothetical protein [Pseudobythopirellula maris]TWT86936.1 hypothetical protein Mal64_37660 [Pseudobythopirellula maris]
MPPTCPSRGFCPTRVAVWGLLAGAALLGGVLSASAASDEAGAALTHNTVRLALAFYLAALLLMPRLGAAGWRAETLAGAAARQCWAWGAAAFVVHLAMAFHFYHHWSHAHAVAHTRQAAGWGEGVFVSYAFTLLWCGDALWWYAAPAAYAARPVALGRTLHAFMLFIVVNGTVVFESGAIRWVSLVALAVLAVAWLKSPRVQRSAAEPQIIAVGSVSDADTVVSAESG